MKTAHLAESFGMHCELHTIIYHPLEIVNLRWCAAISHCQFLELLYPSSYMDFGMKKAINIDGQGYAHTPQEPGSRIEWNWDLIENCSMKVM
jgi:L-alanine-DL-glutamate epimerase-like enolase superfamily enzyme